MKVPPHIIHYIVLILILAGGILTFGATAGDSLVQLLVGIITAVSYVGWGIIHHALSGDLHKKVVIEYALVGGIAIALLVIVLGS